MDLIRLAIARPTAVIAAVMMVVSRALVLGVFMGWSLGTWGLESWFYRSLRLLPCPMPITMK